MSAQAGQTHRITFFGNVNGLLLANFQIFAFTVDGSAASAAAQSTLTVAEIGTTGFYEASYVPDVGGFWNLCMFDSVHNVAVADGVDVDPADQAVNLTQDTGGTGTLKVTQVPNPDEFMLFVIASADWQVGRTDPLSAQAATQLDANGNWLSTPLVLSPGTYHIVIMDNFGTVKVIKPNLTLSV